MKKERGKRGQVTIFIIVAIVIVALAVLVFLFYPNLKSILDRTPDTPQAFLQTCLEDEVMEAAEIVSLQGGSLEPEHSYSYKGHDVEYLCYTGEYYEKCVMQQPMLKSHIEEEIRLQIKDSAEACFDLMVESFERKGYGVSFKEGSDEVELLPERIIVRFNSTLVLTRDGTERINSFEVIERNNLYELISIANSILNFEARYGDSESTAYMNYYRDLKVEKLKQTDGTTIYILTDRNDENKFQFASRSVVFPGGYAAEQVI